LNLRLSSDRAAAAGHVDIRRIARVEKNCCAAGNHGGMKVIQSFYNYNKIIRPARTKYLFHYGTDLSVADALKNHVKILDSLGIICYQYKI
jgi:hypothetical protein